LTRHPPAAPDRLSDCCQTAGWPSRRPGKVHILDCPAILSNGG